MSPTTIADFEKVIPADSPARNFLRRLCVKNFGDFRDVLLDDLILAMGRIETNLQFFPKESEDATTQRLLDMMFSSGYRAERCTRGGNTDITLSLPPHAYIWVGEAKIYKDVGDMREGYLQLATRYSVGKDDLGNLQGGLIGYVKTTNTVKKVNAWRQELSTLPEASNPKITDCSKRKRLAFWSTHTHEGTGLDIEVWHTCISMHFQPKDLSGRKSKRYSS